MVYLSLSQSPVRRGCARNKRVDLRHRKMWERSTAGRACEGRIGHAVPPTTRAIESRAVISGMGLMYGLALTADGNRKPERRWDARGKPKA